MNKKININPNSTKWLEKDDRVVADYFCDLGFRSLKQILDMRVFDLMNMQGLNAVRVEEVIICLYKWLNPNTATPKTKAGIREIPMTEGVKQAFLMEKEFQEECGMKSVSHIEGYSDFVFVNRNGEVQHQGTLNKALQRIMRDCNSEVLEKKGVDSDPVLLPKFSCHVLRHTFATRMCESGLNVKVVQSVLGHADVTTTLDIYVTVTNDLKKREITAFETYLKTGAKQMANV